MPISNEDVDHIMVLDEIKEFLQYITVSYIDKKIITNIILIVFINKNKNSPDWVKEIISLLETNDTDILIPTLKYTNGIEIIFQNLIDKIYCLNNNREINFNNYYITYSMFNDFLDVLYVWFKENFEIN